jgi:Flp pilus assembly protein TadG
MISSAKLPPAALPSAVFQLASDRSRGMQSSGLLQRLSRDDRGAIAVTFALSILLILGMVGLGAEASSWYSIRRDMQNAADLAAESGINSLKANAGGTANTITTYAYNEAKSVSSAHGFANGTNGVVVTPLTPPSSGSYTASSYTNKALEVTISKPAIRLISSLYLASDPTISARAVAIITNTGDCMLATSPTASQAFSAFVVCYRICWQRFTDRCRFLEPQRIESRGVG